MGCLAVAWYRPFAKTWLAVLAVIVGCQQFEYLLVSHGTLNTRGQ